MSAATFERFVRPLKRVRAFCSRLHHAGHAAHAVHAGGDSLVVGRKVGNHAVGREDQRSDRCGVLKCRAGHLRRIEHAHFNHIAVLGGLSVVAEVAFTLSDGVHHDARFIAGIGDDLTQRLFHGAQNDADTCVLFVIVALDVLDGEFGADERDAAARDDAFFNGSASGVQSVFHTGLLFLHFNFSCGTDLDQCNPAGELSHAFLKFFTIVIARGAFDLRADVLDAVFNGRGITGTVNDGRIFFRDFDFLGTAELGKRSFIERKADVARNNRTARKDCDVFEHGAATIVSDPRSPELGRPQPSGCRGWS